MQERASTEEEEGNWLRCRFPKHGEVMRLHWLVNSASCMDTALGSSGRGRGSRGIRRHEPAEVVGTNSTGIGGKV